MTQMPRLPILLALTCFWLAAGSASAQTKTDDTNRTEALARAKSENKHVLLDFAGEKWCPFSKRMEADVLTTPEFHQYADAHLIVVKIECPNPQHASAASIDKFYGSQARYPLGMIPTCVVLDVDRKTLGTLAGYQDGGPGAFLRQLEKL